MQIVIDIPEYIYKLCQGHGDVVYKSIANGTPLPKEHGKIWEENDIKRSIRNEYQLVTILTGLGMVKPIIEAERNNEK